MKVRLPKNGGGMNNLQELAKKAQSAQAEMEKASAELDAKEYTATAGGEAVKITVTGKPEIKHIDIKPETVDPEDTEMLTDMIIAAANEALGKASEEKEAVMQNISEQISMPGLF